MRKVQVLRGVRVRKINLSRKVALCPKCGLEGKRHSNGTRRLREVGISGPTVLEVTYSKHYCVNCRKHFSQSMDNLAPPSSRFTNRVRNTAINFVLRQSMTLEDVKTRMWDKYCVHVPPTTLHDWVAAKIKPE